MAQMLALLFFSWTRLTRRISIGQTAEESEYDFLDQADNNSDDYRWTKGHEKIKRRLSTVSIRDQ